MAERSLAQMTRCSYKEKGNASFRCFKDHLKEKLKTVAPNLSIYLVIITGGMTFPVTDPLYGS
jgi:hypothetical protein